MMPSNGMHPLIQDGADMTPLKPTHLAKVSAFSPREGLCQASLEELPIEAIHQGKQL